jgi:hypothetical protein
MKNKVRIEQATLFFAGLITLSVSPFWSFDAFNVPKFLALTVATFSLLTISISKANTIFLLKKHKLYFCSIGFLLLDLIFVLLSSNINFIEQIFGTFARNTGFVTLACFALYSVIGAVLAQQSFLKRTTTVFLVVGLVDGLYGLLQITGLDPFDWTNPYSPVFGFFGNPNFHSSFQAMSAVCAVTLLFESGINLKRKIQLIFMFLLFLLNIWQSKSIQGFLVLGAAAIFLITIVTSKSSLNKFLRVPVYFLGVILSSAVLLDIFQKSPWKPLLYKSSVSSRGDFWNAGFQMMLDKPQNGVGLDNYGDWYNFYRSADSIKERGANVASNSSHNVFLDYGSNGGIPMFLVYFLIVSLTSLAIVKVFKKSKKMDMHFLALSGVWVAFQVQSIISINQIGLSIWGWLLTGIIIGYQKSDPNEERNQEFLSNKKLKIIPNAAIGATLGLIIALPPFLSDASYRSAIDSQVADQVKNSAYKWPQNTDRMVLASTAFAENNLPEESLSIAKDIVQINPRKIQAWRLIWQNSISTLQEKEIALKNLRKLDPRNPEYK